MSSAESTVKSEAVPAVVEALPLLSMAAAVVGGGGLTTSMAEAGGDEVL